MVAESLSSLRRLIVCFPDAIVGGILVRSVTPHADDNCGDPDDGGAVDARPDDVANVPAFELADAALLDAMEAESVATE